MLHTTLILLTAVVLSCQPLDMDCRYGKVTQNGKFLMVDGPVWRANGQIMDDGRIFLLWVEKSTGRPAPSIYLRGNSRKELIGQWGWGDEVIVDQHGELIGRTSSDEIRPEPQIIELDF